MKHAITYGGEEVGVGGGGGAAMGEEVGEHAQAVRALELDRVERPVGTRMPYT